MNQRGQTPSPWQREAPPPERPCGTKGLPVDSGRWPGSYTDAGWPSGPLWGSASTAGPAPAPPHPGEKPGNGHPPPRPRTHTHRDSRWTHASRGAEALSTRRFEDPGQRLRGQRERRRGSTPPAPRGSRCGRGAYPAMPPLGLPGALRSGSCG